jgi:uncharacterized protein YneF (UPF0154 family)
MKALLYDRSRVDEEGDAMERVVKYVIWLLIALMFGITIGLYCGGVAAKHQFKEQMAIKDQFVMQQLSE